MVAAQPTAMPAVTVVDPQLKPRPTVMIVTIVLTAVCLVQQCWPALVCLAPALIAAVVVSSSVHLFVHCNSYMYVARGDCSCTIMIIFLWSYYYYNNIIMHPYILIPKYAE